MKFTAEEIEAVGINHVKADAYADIELKPYPSEHSCRVNEPSKYVKFARKNGYITVGGKKVDVIFGITKDGKSEIQAYRYPKGSWEASAARGHCSGKGRFEAAKGEEAGLMPSLEEKRIVPNADAVANVEHLIRFGQINKTDQIAFDEVERKSMLGADGKDWKQYGEHFLGIDAEKPEGTRMRHVLPVVKDGIVYAKALIAACGTDSRETARAAWRLCKAANLVPSESGAMRPMKADMTCPVMAAGRGCPMNAVGKCVHMNDSKECDMLGEGCPLLADGGMACPMMKAGEGCPMDSWQGCAQLEEDGGCKLQGGEACCMCESDEGEEE